MLQDLDSGTSREQTKRSTSQLQSLSPDNPMTGQTATGTATLEQQLAQLTVLLSAVHRTRTALPRLVSTLTSSSSSSSGGDRTSLYRTAHQECHAAITQLQDQLDLNALTLQHADQLAREHPPVDPLLLLPPPRPASSTHAPWDKVGHILQTTTTNTKQPRRRSPPPPIPVPTTPADLEALIKAITEHYNARVHIRSIGSRQLEFTLRGVMRARISLRWEDDDDSACQADYVTCYSLMEDVRPSRRVAAGVFSI